MPEILRLEYACTWAEIDQARSLQLRKQLGNGSKWRTNSVMVVALVGIVLGGWFRFREVPEGKRALMLAAIVGGSVLFTAFRRKLRKAGGDLTQVEISEAGVTILNGDSRVVMPWSTFGECLESAELFVLADRPKHMLIVVPKRAFPSENWQDWFREVAANAPNLPASPAPGEAATLSPAADRVTISFHPQYLDSLACTLASWRTRGVCLALAAFMLVCFCFAMSAPRPNAVNSPATVLAMMIPVYATGCLMIVVMFSVLSWRFNRSYAGSREIALSNQGIAYSGLDGIATLTWASLAHYKETSWVFVVWRGSRWVMLPKRSFTSLNDVLQCRDLLDRHLQRSRWFVG